MAKNSTMADARFQIISDLHLETPIQTPSYSHFSSPANFPLEAPHLFLLGDIGLLFHEQPLLYFLRTLLSRDSRLKVFYVMGNHEAYHMTLENAVERLEQWETMLNDEYGSRFYFLNRRRVDLDEKITVLGCTLWSHVPAHHAQDVARTVKDFSEESGIWDRSLDDHNSDHKKDLTWLNEQVKRIGEEERDREMVILTHHSPTTDASANSKRFPPERSLNSAFRTDLSGEVCWMSPNVRLWGFGHTHFSCQFMDEEQGKSKLVVANQKGYSYPGGMGSWKVEPVVVKRAGDAVGVWKVIVGGRNASDDEVKATQDKKPGIHVRGEVA